VFRESLNFKSLATVGIGGFIGIIPMLGFNMWQYGSPLLTGYERQLLIDGGQLGITTHSSRFVVPLGNGFQQLMFDRRLGLMVTVPFWPLWLVAAYGLLSRRCRRPTGRGWVLTASMIICLNVGLFSCYDGALDGSVYLNRYLLPALCLGLAILAAAVQGSNLAEPTERTCQSCANVQEN
jgi:hypothetical protein